MKHSNNRWKQYWDEVAPCPAHRQQPLMDPLVEGERAMHYLETIPPSELFEQLLHVGFIGSFDCLKHASCADIPAVQNSLRQFADFISGWDPSESRLADQTEMLRAFAFLERTVVLGEVLMRKLGDCPLTIRALLDLLIEKKSNVARDERDGVSICDDEKRIISRLFANGSDDKLEEWGVALENEWVMTCESRENRGDFHRIYLKDGVSESRVATVVSTGS